MGNQSRASQGRGFTATGQRVFSTGSVRAKPVGRHPGVRTFRPKRSSERERALRHIASSSKGRRSSNPKVINLFQKIRDELQNLRALRQVRQNGKSR
jgi:hypothetical protein